MNRRGPVPRQAVRQRRKLPIVGVLIISLAALFLTCKPTQPVPVQATKKVVIAAPAKPLPSPCVEQDSNKIILVSISQRRLWACQNQTQSYISPVVTGDTTVAANTTPPGTYKIYAKQTDRYLKGSDAKGNWNEHVNYWMPFLYNQYGAYGFHDADWRPPTAFGTINPSSHDASHGCVELPDATSKWLYDWSKVGTVVMIVQ